MLAIPTASCVTTNSPALTKQAITRVTCEFKAIYWSKRDTAQTVAQIKEHNAVGKAVCPSWGKK